MTETKVKAASAAATVTAFVLWVLGTYVFKDVVPEAVEGLVALVVTGVATWLAGWYAPHTPKTVVNEEN
jgi:hypothetical protein